MYNKSNEKYMNSKVLSLVESNQHRFETKEESSIDLCPVSDVTEG